MYYSVKNFWGALFWCEHFPHREAVKNLLVLAYGVPKTVLDPVPISEGFLDPLEDVTPWGVHLSLVLLNEDKGNVDAYPQCLEP